jgi:multidrug efflux pump subunit AcrA (membrane-fusion protein)
MEVQLSQLWLVYEQAKIKARAPAELVSRRDYQENLLNLERARTEYENQVSKIEQKKKEQAAEIQVATIDKEKLILQLKKYKNNLAGMTLTAPTDGMVIYNEHWDEQRKVQIGDVIWGGFPVVTLPDLHQMEVISAVNEVDGPKLSIGQKATIRLDSYPHIEITGSVKAIAQTAVKASWRTKAKIFKVVISLDKTVTEIMKPGMSAQVSIILSESQSDLVIPRSTLGFESDSPGVVRLEGENNRVIAVTIISSDPFHYAIADNGALKEGDRILSRWPGETRESTKTN